MTNLIKLCYLWETKLLSLILLIRIQITMNFYGLGHKDYLKQGLEITKKQEYQIYRYRPL